MDEFGDKAATASIDASAVLTEQWVAMLTQVSGINRTKAEQLVSSAAGSCPKRLRSALCNPLLGDEQQRMTSLSRLFSQRNEPALSTKLYKLFSGGAEETVWEGEE
jgi:hypothetical protein